jgi:hypothetical protein
MIREDWQTPDAKQIRIPDIELFSAVPEYYPRVPDQAPDFKV